MGTNLEMPYSACIEWFDDWVSVNSPTLVDEYDLSDWMEQEMNDANKLFISMAFKSVRAKNDAILILRAMYYEYFLFQRNLAIKNLSPKPETIERLKNLPQSAQKSAQWHNETLELLTGHEFGSIVYGTPNSRGLVIAKKCGTPVILNEHEPPPGSSQIVFTYDSEGKLSPFKWGWRYEPVVRDVYERCFAEGSVFDGLGRIRHPFLPRLAASPDGLIVSGPRCGRLVEIKSPITRELTGTIPPDYYCQIQLQAEVCDVDAVDYVEMRFTAMLLKDAVYTAAVGAKNPWMGKICVVAGPPVVPPSFEGVEPAAPRSPPESYEYRYSPLFPSTKTGFSDCCAWQPTDISGMVMLEESVWYVYDLFTKTYLRNRRWWAEVGQPAYETFWRDVEVARRDKTYGEKAMFLDTSDDDIVPVGPIMPEKWQGVTSDEESIV